MMPIRIPAITEPVLDEDGQPVLDDDGNPVMGTRLLNDRMAFLVANADHILGSMKQFFSGLERAQAADAIARGLRALSAPQSNETPEPEK